MSSCHLQSLWAAAALEADSRTVLRCWTIIVWNCWTILESSAASETKLGRRQMMLPHSYGAGGFSTSNFFEVPCSIQKVVKFKGRINVQLPAWPHPCHLHSWQAALEAASRTVLRHTLLNGQLLDHYPSQKVTFLRYRAQFKK